MMRISRTLSIGWLAIGLQAYTPPVDTAGPLTVRIMEPARGHYGAGGLEDFAKTDVRTDVEVMLDNSSSTPISGTLRVVVTDRWKVEPAGAVPFRLDARGRARADFSVWYGEGTYNAHYPIHAIAEFEYQGQKMVAHPILLFVAQIPNPPRARLALDWKPLTVPENGAMALWRIPLHRESSRVEEEWLPGTTSRETYQTTITNQFGAMVDRGAAREVIAMGLGVRPPSMRERVTMTRVEYPLRLPGTRPIRLRFANAVGDGVGVPGALFRVRTVAFDAMPFDQGNVVYEHRSDTKRWIDAEVDLSALAGQPIRLVFEASDAAGTVYWAEPTLTAGSPLRPAVFPPPASEQSRSLGEAGGYQVSVWPGKRGLLDSAIGFIDGSRRLLFQGFRVRIAGEALEDWRSNYHLTDFRVEEAAGRYRVRHRLTGWAGSAELLGELWTERGALRAHFWLENAPPSRPWLDVHIESIMAGSWNQKVSRVFAGVGHVIIEPKAFRMSFNGHHMAASYAGFEFADGVSLVQASDIPPDRIEVDPAIRLCSLSTPHAPTMTFIPAKSVWDAVRVWREINGLQAAGGVRKLAGRFIFDLWSGTYGESAAALERAFRYGLIDSAVVWHRWQRWGYDYRLPDLYPPDPEFGTLAEFQTLAQICKSAGVPFAPHDNYIDYYPDSKGFSYGNIIFNPDGTPQKAWFNRGRLAQSYRARPDRVMEFVERNVKLVKEGVAPTAYFIDVWSSMGPYDFWTQDGKFFPKTVTQKAWGETFAWIRNYLGDNAPQISEAGHDGLIGWLDGAQTNHLRIEKTDGDAGFVIPVNCGDAERIPWYDAAHHDRFILHGAGYPGRYEGGLDSRAHGIYSDDYIATEVLTGHPAMVPAPFGREVVRKYWLTHDLMRSIALGQLDGFEFDGQDIHRQRVLWSNGADIAVNRGTDDWTVSDHILPQFGFHARSTYQGGQLEAAIEKRDGVIVEWSRSPEAYYVNARPVVLEPVMRSRENAGPDPRPARMNPENKIVGFPGIRTNGSFRLTREDGAVLLTPLPKTPRFEARINWASLPWATALPRQVEALDENGTAVRRIDFKAEGGEIVLDIEPDLFEYRLR